MFLRYSEFNQEDIGPYGLFSYKYLDYYWTEPERFAFFVKIDGNLAGFALGRQITRENDELINIVSEFFILRKYRRKGIGMKVAHRLFAKYTGKWSVEQEAGNYPAQAFWVKVIDEYTKGNFTESQTENGPVQEFENPENE